MSDRMRQALKSGAGEYGLELTEQTLEKFEIYYSFLVEKNKVMNLTAITQEEQVASLHFLDSLALTEICDFTNAKIIDIGSGAGFPGLPVAMAAPGAELTLLDAQRKRIDFLTELCEKIGMNRVKCIHGRGEEEATKREMREKFDYAFARAVARLNVLSELCIPFVKVGGAFVAMKGRDSEEEIAESKKAIKLLGGKIEKVWDYSIPGTDVVHRAVVIRKISNTPKNYPRRFAKIQKEPIV